jgi:hypothetical protein
MQQPVTRLQTGAFTFCRASVSLDPEGLVASPRASESGVALWDMRAPRPAAEFDCDRYRC